MICNAVLATDMLGCSVNSNGGKIGSVQAARGVAVLLVVLVHAINIADEAPPGLADSWLSRLPALNAIGAIGVDLFFAISGFVMAMMLARRQEPRIGSFALDRLVRIVPLFWIAVLCWWAYPLASRPESGHAWQAVVHAITIIPVLDFGFYHGAVLPPGWTLALELVFYAMVGLALLAPQRWRLGLTLAMTAGATAAGLLFDLPHGWATVLANPLYAEFAFGMLAHAIWARAHSDAARRAVGTGAAVLALPGLALACWTATDLPVEYWQAIIGESGWLRPLAWGLPAALLLLAIACLAPDADRAGRGQWALAELGEASYAIYLSHMFALAAIGAAVHGRIVVTDGVVLWAVIAATWFGVLAHRHVERPVLQLLRDGRTAAAGWRLSRPVRPAPSVRAR